MQDFMTIAEIVVAARKNLSREVWDHTLGGAGASVTVRRNREALARLAFRPRALRDVSNWTTETTLLGHTLSIPVFFAPSGSISRYDPAGTAAVVRVAGRVGTIAFISFLASPVVEEAMKVASGPVILQVYKGGDQSWLGAVVRRGESAGVSGFCFTVDEPHLAFRDRNRMNRWSVDRAEIRPAVESLGWHAEQRPTFCWEDIRRLRGQTKLPIMVKGIQSAEDAKLAVEHGVDVVYVSNHGGHALDDAPGTVDVLESVVKAVGGRAEVVVDSGFVRGTDVVKGLALGARAVGVGKLTCWSLAAGGEPALEQAYRILQEEMDTTLGNLGVTSPAHLGPECITREYPPVTAARPEDLYWLS